ncbi:MAG: von Willebrand factor type A domain-containing protein [Coriobacteriales bacterium]|nr:von Willebrand factor type A domain-containing protein [Coriobacteriales bacterium]
MKKGQGLTGTSPLVALMVLLLSSLLALSGCNAGPSGSERTSESYSDESGSEMGGPSFGSPDYDYYYEDSGGERYAEIDETGEQLAEDKPEATFSLKVDTASYSNFKRYVEDGMLPPPDAVRTEEFINWFSFDEPLEFASDGPFAFYTEVGPSPFDDEKNLALVRVGTREVDRSDLPPSNLVFLIDISGSMNSYDKLPLLQEAFAMLTETLGRDDRVSIVTYASGTYVALAGARGSDSRAIDDAIFSLSAGGSTAGEQGIQEAYELAEEFFIEGGNNRVILATDGDFNVGLSDTDELSRFIAKKRQSDVYLSVLGFGTGNIRDDIMETLATDGNGNYSYIDSLKTAEKVLVDELGSNLFTVADDVKAQVVFDPQTVHSYRLIGYENRMLQTRDFDDDRKDAGEIGAGADVVALFEFEPTNEGTMEKSHLFDVRIRYKDPGDSESQLVEFPVATAQAARGNSSDFDFVSAVALFGDYLRSDGDGGRRAVREIVDLAENNLGTDTNGYRQDFVNLLHKLPSSR